LSANGPQAVAQLPSAENDNVKKVPQAVAQLPASDFSENLQLVAKIPWGHHILLMEKIKDLPARLWYMRQTIEQGWSRNVLGLMIKSNAHKRQGAAVTNFEKCLPDPQSDQARQALKDPYIFDFLTLVKKINKKRSLDQQFGTFFNAENDYGYEQEKHLGNINIMIDKITSCEISFNSGFDEKHAMLSLLDDYFFIDCNLLQDGDDLIKMSPGKRGIILFQLFLHLSKSKNPILIDQPEDNLDNRTVYQELNGFIKTKKSTRQIIIVSHNPNLVVSTDSENIIVANQDGQNKSGKNNTFKFEYVNGAIEHSFDKDRINLAERFKRLSPETVITIL
ncbi:MAG: DUF1016 N-terminal domain-containing protein, partial [Thermodesulfobacteriota bacterium]|nr:DUF1016 N-terminal domain-containing protein [Thermodesulfobacteriota bacterium]